MTSTPEADPRLVGARDLALAALQEITPASTVGPAAGHRAEDDGSVSLRFENRLAGYPGWYWTVTVAQVDDAEPTVLEVELMPGDGALLAPDWVPWAERLAEYRAHQVELAEQAAATAADSDEDAELDDDGFDDDLSDEDDEPRTLHAGDLDGVDIDELDESLVQDDDDLEEDDDAELGADDDLAADDEQGSDEEE